MKKLVLLLTIISHFVFGQNISTKYDATTKKSYLQTGVAPKANIVEYTDTVSGKSPIWQFDTPRIKYKNQRIETDTSKFDKVNVGKGDSAFWVSKKLISGSGAIDTLKVGRIEQGRGTTAGSMYFNGVAWVKNDTSYVPRNTNILNVNNFFSVGLSGYDNTLSMFRNNNTSLVSKNITPLGGQSNVIVSSLDSGYIQLGIVPSNVSYSRLFSIKGTNYTYPTKSFEFTNGLAHYNGDYRTYMIDDETIPDIGKVAQMVHDTAVAHGSGGSGITSVYSANSDIAVDSSITGKRKLTLNKTLTSGYINIGDATNTAFPRAISGDATISNLGALLFSNVNSNVGTFGGASKTTTTTVNAKGLVTGISEQNIAIAESQVTNLTSDLSTLTSNVGLKANTASPTFTGTVTIPSGAVMNTPASIGLANATGLPLPTGVTGVLPVTNGGIGIGNLTGIAKGNGTGAFTTAIEGTDYVSPSSLNKIKLNERTQIVGIGDSYTAGNGATSPTTQGFYYTVQASVNGFVQNLGVGGTGGTGAFRRHCQNVAINNLKPTLLLIGLNDITRDVSSKCINMITGAHRAIFAAQFLKTAVPANSGSVSTTGTWTTITGGTYNDKASLSLSGLGRQSTVSGSTLTYTSTGDNVVIGTWGCDQAQLNDGGFTVSVDGTLMATYSPTGKAKYISGVTDSGGRDRFIGRSNDAVVIRGLSGGTHTIVITTTSSNPTLIDYIGVMNAPNLVAPLIFGTVPKINANSKAYFLSTYSITLTDADFDNVDAAVSTMLAEFVGMPVGRFNTNKYYDCNTQAEVATPALHPNTIGHGNIARSVLELIDAVTIGGRQTIKNSLSATIYRALNDIDNTAQFYIVPSTQATAGLLSPNAVIMDANAGNLMMGTQAAAKVGLYVSLTEVFNVTSTKMQHLIGGVELLGCDNSSFLYTSTASSNAVFQGTSNNIRAKSTSTTGVSNLLATNDASLSAQVGVNGSATAVSGIVGPSYAYLVGNTPVVRVGSTNASGRLDFWVAASSDAASTAVKGSIGSAGNWNTGGTTSSVYRTTNGGGDVTSHFFIDPANSLTSGNAIGVDATNGLVFTRANATRRIARGAFSLANNTDTPAGEKSDMIYSSQQTAGAAISEAFRWTFDGKHGIGVTSPTAILHLKAGTATASTAPLKFTSGTDLTTKEAGAFYYDGTRLGFSPSTTLKRIALTNDVAPSNGQIGIGNGTDFTTANITAGINMIVTNGSGSITISADTTTGATKLATQGDIEAIGDVTYERVLKTYHADVANATDTETDLILYTIPANLLNTNGKSIDFEVALTFVGAAPNSHFRINGSNQWGYTNTLGQDAVYKISLMRDASSTAKAFMRINSTSGDTYEIIELSGLDFTTTNTISISGVGNTATSSSVTARGGVAKYLPNK